MHRRRDAAGPYGEPVTSVEQWRRDKARALWQLARMDWCRLHGWPGGLDVFDLLRLAIAPHRAKW